jgi:hypothetical protein
MGAGFGQGPGGCSLVGPGVGGPTVGFRLGHRGPGTWGPRPKGRRLASRDQCPLAEAYAPRLAELARDFGKRDVAFFDVANQRDVPVAISQFAEAWSAIPV